MDIIKELNNSLKNSVVSENVEMSSHTSFRTGGCADYFVAANCVEDIITAIDIFKKNGVEYYIWGNGSNILVTDKGIRGAVIKPGKDFEKVCLTGDNEIYAGAASSMASVAAFAAENELAGFEFASGIPGSFGGGIFMNAGAYDGEIKDVLIDARVIDKDGNVMTVPAAELELSYRKSAVEEKGFVVLGGTIRLHKGKKEDIKALMNDLNSRRREKQPLNYPSAGSTFKRPAGSFAGKLIEESGLKGFSVGGAEVSEKHAGFVINKGNAVSDDIIRVIEHCIDKVYCDTGIKLEPEVRIIGER